GVWDTAIAAAKSVVLLGRDVAVADQPRLAGGVAHPSAVWTRCGEEVADGQGADLHQRRASQRRRDGVSHHRYPLLVRLPAAVPAAGATPRAVVGVVQYPVDHRVGIGLRAALIPDSRGTGTLLL